MKFESYKTARKHKRDVKSILLSHAHSLSLKLSRYLPLHQ